MSRSCIFRSPSWASAKPFRMSLAEPSLPEPIHRVVAHPLLVGDGEIRPAWGLVLANRRRPQREGRGPDELPLQVVCLVADEQLSLPDILGVPQLAEEEGVVADGDLLPERVPLLLVVGAELPAPVLPQRVLALGLPVAQALEVVLVLVEGQIVRAVGERPVGLAPPLAARDQPPRAGGDKAREVRLAHDGGESKVRGVLRLELLGRGEDVGRPEVPAERGRDRRLAEPDRRFKDDELLPGFQRRLDLLQDVLLKRPHRLVGK